MLGKLILLFRLLILFVSFELFELCWKNGGELMELPLLLLVRPPIAVLGRSDSREGR